MKKILLATTMLASTVGVAAADVTISGYGRFGAEYRDDRAVGAADTILRSRLRFNIDATTETDSGVTFGGRLRFENNSGDEGTFGNNAQFSASFSGLTVSVGNVDTAMDSVGLIYNSEMGYMDSSFGDIQGAFFAYASQPVLPQFADYYGIAATYSFGDANFYFSFVDPDQTVTNPSVALPAAFGGVLATDEEIGIAFDYTTGAFTVAAGYTANGFGIADNDLGFLGAAYAIGENANVGINLYDNGTIGGVDVGNQVTLYGNYTMDALTLRAYVSDLDQPLADTAYGIGADYALGNGARVSGSIQSGFASETKADVGVRFNF